MRGWVLLPVLAVACGGTGRAPPDPRPPEPKPVAVATAATTAIAPESPAPQQLDARYAPSALTELAENITQLVAVVIDGNPPPPGPLPLERRRRQDKLVRGNDGAPRSRELRFLGVAFEIDLVLVADDPTAPRPGDSEPDGTLRTVAFVGRSGLKVASLHVHGPRATRPLGVWLGGAEQYGKNVLEALRNGRLGELLMGESERALFANDQVWREVEKELPKAEVQARAKALAHAHPRSAGYRMDDIIVIARDARGGFWGFALHVDEDEGQAVLDTHPLVRIEKLDPNRGF